MPDRYVNTVPQGVTGTGNAQVFGVNPLAGQFASQLSNLRRQQELQAQQMAKAWRDNQLAASSGRLWASDMAGIEKDFINRGIDLQKKGVNPYGSSQEALDYQRDKRYVEAQQGYRKAVETRLNDALTKVNANPSKYDPKSIQRLNEFFAKTKLADAFNSNMDIPQLQERFDVTEYLKPFKAITQRTDAPNADKTLQINEKIIDEPRTQNMLIWALAQDPRGQQYLSELTSGFAVPEVKSFSPTYSENLKMVTDYVNGNPKERERLALQGVLPGTPLMKEYISDLAQKQTDARKKFDTGMKDLVGASATGEDLFREEDIIKDPNAMTPYQRESLALRRAALAKKGAGTGGGAASPPKDLTFSFGETTNGKKPSFTGKGTVPLTSAVMNMHGTNVIDAATGKPIKIAESSNDFAVTELTHAPILTKDVTVTYADGRKETLKKGAIVQDKFAEKNPGVVDYKKMGVVQKPRTGGKFSTYYIDADLIPTNTFSKKTQAQYDSFKATPTPQTQAAPVKSTVPKAGTVEGGYRFKGGNPADPKNWEKVK